VKIWWSKI